MCALETDGEKEMDGPEQPGRPARTLTARGESRSTAADEADATAEPELRRQRDAGADL